VLGSVDFHADGHSMLGAARAINEQGDQRERAHIAPNHFGRRALCANRADARIA
jgi:hypothetical protein